MIRATDSWVMYKVARLERLTGKKVTFQEKIQGFTWGNQWVSIQAIDRWLTDYAVFENQRTSRYTSYKDPDNICEYSKPVEIVGPKGEEIEESRAVSTDEFKHPRKYPLLGKEHKDSLVTHNLLEREVLRRLRKRISFAVREWPFCTHANAPVELKIESFIEDGRQWYWGEWFCPHCGGSDV